MRREKGQKAKERKKRGHVHVCTVEEREREREREKGVRTMKFNLKNFPNPFDDPTLTALDYIEKCKDWKEAFEAELREKLPSNLQWSPRTRERYELIKEILGE